MESTHALPLEAETTSDRQRLPVDLLRAYKLRIQHKMSYGDIAETLGQPKSSIHRAFHDICTLLDDPERLQHYEEARPKIITAVEERLMQSLVDETKLEKASLRDSAVAFGIVHDKRRLEEGKSTGHISVLGKFIVEAEARLGAPKAAPAPTGNAPAGAAKEDEDRP